MFRVLDIEPDGAPSASEGPDRVGLPPKGSLRWVDLQGQDSGELELLRERFRFHPLAIEDCANFGQRPKLEEYGDHMFIVTHGLACEDLDRGDLEIDEVHAFVGERWLVTVHTETLEPIEKVWKRMAMDPALGGRGADFAYYLVADAIVDMNFPLLDRVADELEAIETAVLSDPEPYQLARMFRLKRLLVAMRKVLSPQRDVFALLSRRVGGPVSERTSLYFRDVYDHLARLNEAIETSRDLLGNCFDAYLSAVSNRTNDIMKRLTIMSAIFLPLAFVVGFFGQNFENLPFLTEWMKSVGLMWAMVVVCVATPTVMLVWFRLSRWW